ncbi:AAA family ATPase [Phaeacidiphilus oryzae]|uniref:AAA family ATPase n=1 Tax=Phaeacidiphilus oryzae TaxID=348818 RepID=UPI00068F000A|nr:AAA family ATPase [Phaeacidiphilus oryzae]
MTAPAAFPPDDSLDAGPSLPHDIDAEQAFVGALITDPRRLRTNLAAVAPADYYRPAHAIIHTTIQQLHDDAQAVDPITLTAALQAAGHLGRVGGRDYLHTCITQLPAPANADWYAERIRDLALRRALITTGSDIAAMGYDPASGDPAELAERAVALARDVRDAGRAAEDSPVLDVHDFLAIDDTAHDWVLPGLLEHGDRIVWTAGEGGGKSVLQRQLAVSAAAGAQPFEFEPNALGPQKVLVLDCENSERQSRRHFRDVMNAAERRRTPVKRGQLHVDVRPEGVDLTRPDGRAWLMRRVEAVMPDLLIIGPIYRLHTGDPNSEEHARRITVVLDEARATANCAISLEAHSPQGSGFGPRTLRPAGSSLWLRWPEFGLGLRPVEDERSAREHRARRILPWRGARDERTWPSFICQGYEGSWPWRSYKPVDADPYSGYSPTGAVA